MELSHSILGGLDKLISNKDNYKRKGSNCEFAKQPSEEAMYSQKHNLKDNKNLHKELAQSCQSVFDIIYSLRQKFQFEENLRPKGKRNVNDQNEELLHSPNTKYNYLISALYEQMNQSPKCYIKLKNILKVEKIASIFKAQIPCIETKQQKQQMQILILRRAIKQYSKRLWTNNEYVRCLDLCKGRAKKHISLFYIDELSSSIADKYRILEIFDSHCQTNTIQSPCSIQLQVQLIQSCVQPSSKSQFYQTNQQQHAGDEMEMDCETLNKIEENNSNLTYSAWVYTSFSDSIRTEMNKKIRYLQQRIMQSRPNIEHTYKLKIYSAEQHRISEQMTEDLIEGISKLSINPFISHQNYSEHQISCQEKLIHFDNSSFFNC